MRFQIERNDITDVQVDAIVIPANKFLREGSGTSAAIYEKAGRHNLVNACKEALKKYGMMHVGTAIHTLGYDLDAKYILHAIVPKWHDGNHQEYEMLCASYLSALKLADMIGCESVAFPLLAAGNNGFDLELAFRIAQECITTYEATHRLTMAYLIVYDAKVMDMLRAMNVEVIEKIDEEYILKTKYKAPLERIPHTGKNYLQDYVDTKLMQAKDKMQEQMNAAKEKADDMMKVVGKYMAEPENRKVVYEEAAYIFKTIVNTVQSCKDSQQQKKSCKNDKQQEKAKADT